jgi:FtsH-binding integral membrane protein
VLVIAGMLAIGVGADVWRWFAVQLIPAALAALFVALNKPVGIYGAPAIFVYWLMMLALIIFWLFTNGARHDVWYFVLAGIVVAVSIVCAAGIVLALRAAAGGNRWRRSLGVAAFAAFQIGAWCLSSPFFDASGA